MAQFDIDQYLKKDSDLKQFDIDQYLTATKPETKTQRFTRSAVSLADTVANIVTGTLDQAAYPLARAYYGLTMPPAQAAQRAQTETTSPKDVLGRWTGLASTQGYQEAPLRQLGEYIAPALEENIIKPVAQSTGLPEQDVANMVGTATLMAPKVLAPVKPVAQAVGDVAAGAYGAATGGIARPGQTPRPGQTASSRVRLESTYIPSEVMEAWRRGELTAEQAQQLARPSTDLPSAALARTGGMVPYKNQAWRAVGEQIGEVYRNPVNILTDVGLDVLTGSPLPTLGRMAYKGAQVGRSVLGARELSRYGFSPISPLERQELRSAAVKNMAASKIMPVPPGINRVTDAIQQTEQQAANMRMPIPTENQMMLPLANDIVPRAEDFRLTPPAAPELTPQPAQPAVPQISSTPPSALELAKTKTQLRQDIDTTAVAAITRRQGKTSIDQAAFNDAVESQGYTLDWATAPKVDNMPVGDARRAIKNWAYQQIRDLIPPEQRGPRQSTIVKQTEQERQAMTTPEQRQQQDQAMLERSRKMLGSTQVSRDVAPQIQSKTAPQPVKMAAPVQPEQVSVAAVNPRAVDATLEAIRQKMKTRQTQTAEPVAPVEQPKKNKPSGTMEMKTGNLPEFPNKQEFKKQEMIDKLAGRITEGTYVDNGLRYEVSAIDYGNAPKELLERLNKPLTQVRVISEKTGKQVSGPAPETPAKSIRQQVEKKLNKRK